MKTKNSKPTFLGLLVALTLSFLSFTSCGGGGGGGGGDSSCPASSVCLWLSKTKYDGDLDGFTGAHAKCAATGEQPAHVSGKTTHKAVIFTNLDLNNPSSDASDYSLFTEASGPQKNYPVYQSIASGTPPNITQKLGEKIADKLETLMNSTSTSNVRNDYVLVTRAKPYVKNETTDSDPIRYWTGAAGPGDMTTEATEKHCDEWENNDAGMRGVVGDAAYEEDTNALTWVNLVNLWDHTSTDPTDTTMPGIDAIKVTCDTSLPILCASY